jgi:penicillin-binding protein 2
MSTNPAIPTDLRLRLLIVVVGCLFAALLARLWDLQVLTAPSAHAAAAAQGVETIYDTAPRGEILDRNGNVLVGDTERKLLTSTVRWRRRRQRTDLLSCWG